MSGNRFRFPEDLLHFIWKTKRFDIWDLKTADGQILKITDFGTHNHDAGPDFLDGRIELSNTIWRGHIELHILASDWYSHGHQTDPAYDNVILHVVYEKDCEVYRRGNKKIAIPTLELRDRIDRKFLARYTGLQQSLEWIPCASLLKEKKADFHQEFITDLMARRLQRKSQDILEWLGGRVLDWESALMKLFFKHIGSEVNADAFMRLASITPHRILLKCAHKLPVLEALLFGQAGLITGHDKYATRLKEEYRFLKRKYHLIPMRAHLWKFSRTRPSNFPTIRIAQLAAVYHKSPGLFGKILETECRKNLIRQLDVNSSPYWKDHYSFGRKSAPKEKRLGRSTINILIINVFVPLIFTYARIAGNEKMLKVFLQMIKDTPPESNRITRKWAQMGYRPHNALESQALIELKNNFCDNHRCLDCEIGQQLISR